MTKKKYVILISLLFTVLHTTLFLSPSGEFLEWRLLRFWFWTRGVLSPPQDVVIVALDEESYRELGVPLNQPWPRLLHAKLLDRLAQAGAKRVVFDVLFLDAAADENVDLFLAQAMKKIPTVLGAEYVQDDQDNYRNNILRLPHQPFLKAALKTGLVGFPVEAGRVQRFYISPDEVSQKLPSLAEAAIASTVDRVPAVTSYDFINFYGPPGTVKTYPVYQVLETEKPLSAERFRDKIVFIGLSLRTGLGPDIKDTYLTPFSESSLYSGVEIHATATLNLLTKNWIHRASFGLELFLLACACFLITSILLCLKPQPAALVLLGFTGCWIGTGFILFRMNMFLPGACLCFIVLPTGYLIASLHSYLRVRQSQRQLEQAFGLYLSPQMAHQVSRHQEVLRLGGEKLVATAMFTDIAYFTEITDGMDAEEVAKMLNSYFTEMVNVIFEKQGTLIKFIGDAVFALWGAPIKTPHHARLACEAAVHIQKVIAKWNESENFPRLETRIGIHTGMMVVGNLGSARRFDFTAIGDSVNLASRIEGINKYFGTSVIVSESVKHEIDNLFHPFLLGHIQVAGKEKSTKLYTLFEPNLPPYTTDLWLQMLTAFQATQWNRVEDLLSEISSLEPQLEKAVQIYRSECTCYRLHAPVESWQGELIFESK